MPILPPQEILPTWCNQIGREGGRGIAHRRIGLRSRDPTVRCGDFCNRRDALSLESEPVGRTRGSQHPHIHNERIPLLI